MAAVEYYDFTYMEFISNRFQIAEDIRGFEQDLDGMIDNLTSPGVVDYSKDRIQSSFDEQAKDALSLSIAVMNREIKYLWTKYNGFEKHFKKTLSSVPQKDAIIILSYFAEKRSLESIAGDVQCQKDYIKKVVNEYVDRHGSYVVPGLRRTK